FYDINGMIPVHRLGTCDPGASMPRSTALSTIKGIRKIAQELKPDVVVAFMHSSYVLTSVALFGVKIPLIISEHIDAAHFKGRPLQRFASNVAFLLSAAKTVPSTPVRLEHARIFRSKVFTVENPVCVESSRAANSRESPLILSAGRFMEQKDFETLIAAFAVVASEFPEWRLKIVGDGELRDYLENRCRASGYADRIELPGVAKNMAKEYEGAAIFALPSRYESFGLVVAEAMASGLPVVAFDDCLGPSSIINHNHDGLLVSAQGDRVAALVEALRSLMSDPLLRARLGSAGSKAIDRFSIDRIAHCWESLFMRVLEGQYQQSDFESENVQ
ncbi:MAG: glycosyltransferase, partial [Alteraurantiacibacter sp. bin_em_oilr2.035]|nr:glycosyltransferase [Alteraurantiacibacter sp. bin_em_oilr2.035]